MNRLFLFNPDNDAALAFGRHHYSAPKNAALIRECGAFLPAWIAEKGDYIMCRQSQAADERVVKAFGLECSLFTADHCHAIKSLSPWGWSPAVKDDFLAAGISETVLPDEETLSRLRELSHRRSSIIINRRLHEAGIETPPMPVELHESSRLEEIISRHGNVFVKSPWSSSGRGVFSSSSLPNEELKRRVEGIINRRGSVIIEKQLDKIADFAMLFKSDGSETKFIGLSVFSNARMTAYSGNIIAPQKSLHARIEKYISPDVIDKISNSLEAILTDTIAPYYTGYLGIDMMIYHENERYRVAPCVELNLRTTMGIVALRLAENYLADGSEGTMIIEYGPGKQFEFPVVESRRLVEGTVQLVAPNPHFQYLFTARRL